MPGSDPDQLTTHNSQLLQITALDVAANGMVYAGTSGYLAHLLVGMFHGVTGMVLDMGAVEGANQTVAICCGRDAVVAAVNGPAGGRLVMRELQERTL